MVSLRSALFIACALGFSNGAGSAQVTQTTRPVGDTLYFRQTITTKGFMDAGVMADSMNSVMRFRVAYAFAPGDTIRMWVDSAAAEVKAAGVDQATPLDMLLNKKIVLHAPPGGKMTTVSSELPDEFDAIMDEAGFDMTSKLAKGGDLKKGASWTDTTSLDKEMPGGLLMKGRDITRMEVIGDSVMNGYAVVIIATSGDNTVSTSMTMGAMSMDGTQVAKSEGRLYYSPVLQNAIYMKMTSTGSGTQNVAGQSMKSTSTTVVETRLVRR